MSAADLNGPRAFKVKPEWRALPAAFEQADGGPLYKDLAKSLNAFLAEGQTHKVQLAEVRRLANLVGKAAKANDHAAATFVLSCIRPIAIGVHFSASAPSESSFRVAVFGLISSIDDVYSATAPQSGELTVRAELNTRYSTLLVSVSSPASTNDWEQVLSFGGVLLAMLDKPLGKTVVENQLLATFRCLLALVTLAIPLAEDGDTSTKTQFVSVCTDLLKIISSLLTRTSAASQQLARTENGAALFQIILDTVIYISFGPPAFGTETHFISGFLVVSVALLFDNHRHTIQTLLFPDTTPPARLGPVTGPTFNFPTETSWVEDENHTYAALCVFRGVLTSLRPEDCLFELEAPSPTVGKETLLRFLYTRIAHAINYSTVAPVRLMAYANMGSWLACVLAVLKHARAASGATGVAASQSTATDLISPFVNAEVVMAIFAHVFNDWEDPIETVQHKLKDIFLNLVDVAQASFSPQQTDELMNRIMSTLLAADWHRKVKYDLLSLMLAKVSPKTILALRPDFLGTCFEVMETAMLASRIVAFVAKFLKKAFAETPADSSSLAANAYWLIPVCHALTSPSATLRKVCSENVIKPILQERKEAVELLIAALDDRSIMGDAAGVSPYRVHATIAIIKAARFFDLIQLNSFLAENRTMLTEAISHPDSNLRIDVLALLCETRQKTADFSVEEIAALKSFLNISLDSQSPDFRQRVQAYMVKLLRRMRAAMYADWRDLVAHRVYIDKFQSRVGAEMPGKLATMVAEADNLAMRLERKREFFQWMCDFSVGSLFPGCSFQRATSNLMLAATILASYSGTDEEIDARVSLADMPNYPTLATPENVRVLIALITNDTYAPNRDTASDLLTKFPAPLPGFPVPAATAFLHKAVSAVATGIRSHQSDAGATLVRLVFEKYVKQAGLYLTLKPTTTRPQTGCPMVYFLEQLVLLLRTNINVAKSNLYLSSTGHPMHGLFRTLQYALLQVDMASETVQGNAAVWNALIEDILQLIGDACETVLSVCADESPEGNLPASFADMQRNMEEVIAQADAGEDEEETSRGSEAQLMLYACFHTIKETSAVLQALLCRTPLPESDQARSRSVSITHEQIVRSGNLLRRLLASIRHRGAFSAVHLCFSSLCATLLSSGRPLLVQLLEDWLEGFFAQVVSVDVSITRRSAGLPLGVLAIVSAPVPHRQPRKLLIHAMQRLLAIGMQPIDETVMLEQRLDLPQVHAYNIIRAILQDSSISESTREFLGDSFALTLVGFSSPSFPVRNCAAMLFSTLLQKALGTKKTRDEHHIVNTVTAREFFARFPALRSHLLAELEDAVAALEDGKTHPALFPILTVLARLKPSAVEVAIGDQASPMTAFRPLLVRCASTTIYKARAMSARAFAPLVPPSELVDCVAGIMQSAVRARQNAVHGSLLQVQNLLRVHFLQAEAEELDSTVREAVVARLPEIFQTAAATLYDNNSCIVTKALYIEVAAEFVVDLSWANIPAGTQPAASEFRNALCARALSDLTGDGPAATDSPLGTYDLRRAQAELVLKTVTSGIASGADLIVCLLEDRDYEVQLSTLRYLAKERDFAFGPALAGTLARLVLSGTKHYYQVGLEAAGVLEGILTRSHEDAVIGACDASFMEGLISLLENSKQKPGTAQALLPLLGTIWVKHPTETFTPRVLNLLSYWLRDEQPLATRLSVVKCLSNAVSLPIPPKESDYSKLLFVYLTLLEDDDPDVREGTAAVICHVVLKTSGPITAPRCRDLLAAFITEKDWQSPETIARRFMNELLSNEALSTLTFKFDGSSVLFAREAENSRREPFIDARIAARSLSSLLGRAGGASAALRDVSAELRADVIAASDIVITAIEPAASCQPDVFSALARLGAAQRALKSGDVGEASQVLTKLEAWIQNPEVHPALRTLWRDEIL
ncbi:hypothetical protein HDU87_006137 [Geranomyces variabilis]|uniref:Uncharacterized protein n=1 Tax=Geranomyces variabilis TaxID=109894 RepID=A0AAD5TFT4_9FUNG|nr:hypothetical protein HDU87_006137 [Geranomyces variabilis]